MKRQNKDGRPIYNDSIWFKMVETGKKLEKLGFIESKKKPNLFYKEIKYTTEKETKKKKGFVYADLRGTDIIPIWEDSNPLVYFKDLPFKYFIPEFIRLQRAGCNPRVSFYEMFEPDGWMFGLGEIPSGYCLRCGEDIVDKVNWDILKEDMYEIYNQGVNTHMEVNYCKVCKKIEYSMREYRLQFNHDFKVCELCGLNKAELNHHITYHPPKIIKLCRSCHGKLHKRGFPNPLWKEKKSEPLIVDNIDVELEGT